MNYGLILKTTGNVMILEAAAMLPSLLCCAIYGESAAPFLLPVVLLLAAGSALSRTKNHVDHFFSRDAFVCVCLIWFVLSFFGAFPFLLSGRFPSFIDCLFESISGFTTTGASILTEVESLPKSILFWRSFTHFIGGMGILVLANALLPSGGNRSQHLMRAEVPGPTSDKLVPKLSQSSKLLYLIYSGMTVTEAIALLLCGLDLFDALTLAFGTAGTGGFAATNASVGAYGSPAVEWVIGIFMLLFSINFTLHFLILTGKAKKVVKNEELHWYLLIFAGAMVIMTANTASYFDTLGDAIRSSFFNVATIISTTGYGITDTNLWPQLSKTVIVLLMAMGAMAGSTGGGMKCSRIVMLFKSVAQELKQIIHPNSVKIVRMDGKRVEDGTVTSVLRFFGAYVLITFFSTLIISVDGHDLETTFTAVLSAISNIGPGFGLVGATGNFAFFSGFSKCVLSLCMIAGRLEVFPVLIFFFPATWKKA